MNLVVVPSATSGSPSSNAWPARPRQASSRHILPPTSLRALHRVPSSAVVRAYPPAPRPSASSGSVNSLETGSESPLSSTQPRNVMLSSFLNRSCSVATASSCQDGRKPRRTNRSRKTSAPPLLVPPECLPRPIERKPASRFTRSVSMVGHFPLFSRYEVDYNNMESVVHHACLHRTAKK